MANENILRSYLASIGYKVDEDSYRKFKENLSDSSKKMKEMGAVAVAMAAEITASVIKVASNMEQLYFATQRSGATAKNLQALRFGAEQIGISADRAQSLVENLASMVRSQPGMVALLRALHVNPQEDKVKLLIDLVTRLKQFSDRGQHAMAATYASAFGIDEPTLAMLEKNLDELKKQMEANRKANPIDDDKLKKFHEFMVQIRVLTAEFQKLVNVVAGRFLPIIQAVLPYLIAFIDFLIKLDAQTHGASSIVLGLASAFYALYGAAKLLRVLGGFLGLGTAAEASNFLGTLKAISTGLATTGLALIVSASTAIWLTTKRWHEELAGIQDIYHNLGSYLKHPLDTIKGMFSEQEYDPELRKKGITEHDSPEQKAIRNFVHGLFPSISADLPGQGGNVQQLLGTYASKFGIDPSLLKALAYQESRFNQKAVSKKGAVGVMQLMPDTAKQLGVDPFSLEGNIAGGARYLADLLKKYGGNEMKALAAYNAGPAAVDKYGGVPPFAETQNYVNKILQYRLGMGGVGSKPPVSIQQKTEINVNGSGDPLAVGDRVLKGQDDVNADMVRNMGAVAR